MAKFRGGINSGYSTKDVTRLGHKSRGIRCYAETYQGRIFVELHYDFETDKTIFEIYLTEHGKSTGKLIAKGELDFSKLEVIQPAKFKRKNGKED